MNESLCCLILLWSSSTGVLFSRWFWRGNVVYKWWYKENKDYERFALMQFS